MALRQKIVGSYVVEELALGWCIPAGRYYLSFRNRERWLIQLKHYQLKNEEILIRDLGEYAELTIDGVVYEAEYPIKVQENSYDSDHIDKISIVGFSPELEYDPAIDEVVPPSDPLKGYDLSVYINDSPNALRGVHSIELKALGGGYPVQVKLGFTVKEVDINLPHLNEMNRTVEFEPVRYTFHQFIYGPDGTLKNDQVHGGPYTFWGFPKDLTAELLYEHLRANGEHLPLAELADHPQDVIRYEFGVNEGDRYTLSLCNP